MDTSVILAQPRVSRLRAAAGYVDRRGSPGLAGAHRGFAGRIPDPGLPNAGFARAPPKITATDSGFLRKKSGIGSRDLAAKIQVFHCPKSKPIGKWDPPCYGRWHLKFGFNSPEFRVFSDFRPNPHFLILNKEF